MLRTVALVAACAGLALAQGSGPYVWDLLPTPLNAAQVTELFVSAVPGETFPIYNEVPSSSFTCSGKLGYYADPAAGCQAFRRCTLGGDLVSYLCPNGTLFNQLVLVCDWWFNVDCSKAESFYNFANPRIYGGPGVFLHDTPPPTYIAPWQRKQLEEFQRLISEQQKSFGQIEQRLQQSQQGGQGGQSSGSPQSRNLIPSAASAQQPQQQQQQQEQPPGQQGSSGFGGGGQQQQSASSDASEQQNDAPASSASSGQQHQKSASSGAGQQQNSAAAPSSASLGKQKGGFAQQQRGGSSGSSSGGGGFRSQASSSNSGSFRSSSSSSQQPSGKSNSQQQSRQAGFQG